MLRHRNTCELETSLLTTASLLLTNYSSNWQTFPRESASNRSSFPIFIYMDIIRHRNQKMLCKFLIPKTRFQLGFHFDSFVSTIPILNFSRPDNYLLCILSVQIVITNEQLFYCVAKLVIPLSL